MSVVCRPDICGRFSKAINLMLAKFWIMGKFFKMAKENNIRNATFKDNWMDIFF